MDQLPGYGKSFSFFIILVDSLLLLSYWIASADKKEAKDWVKTYSSSTTFLSVVKNC